MHCTTPHAGLLPSLSLRCTAGRRAQPAREGWQGGLGHPGSAARRAEMAKNRWQGQPHGGGRGWRWVVVSPRRVQVGWFWGSPCAHPSCDGESSLIPW